MLERTAVICIAGGEWRFTLMSCYIPFVFRMVSFQKSTWDSRWIIKHTTSFDSLASRTVVCPSIAPFLPISPSSPDTFYRQQSVFFLLVLPNSRDIVTGSRKPKPDTGRIPYNTDSFHLVYITIFSSLKHSTSMRACMRWRHQLPRKPTARPSRTRSYEA